MCFLRNQIPRHTTSALPRLILITHRAALILYGRSGDRNHCLVYRHFYKVGACFPFALLLFSVGGPHPGSSHRRLVPSSAPIDCLATIRTQELPGTQSLGAIHLVIGYQRVPSGYIFSLANV